MQFKRTLELDSSYAEAHFAMGITFMVMKRYDEAIASLKSALRLSGNRLIVLSMLADAENSAGNKGDARKIFNDLREMNRKSHVSPYYFGVIERGLGEPDKAIDYFSKAYDERDGILIFTAVDPMAEAVRSNPRFLELLKKMGLEPVRPQQ